MSGPNSSDAHEPDDLAGLLGSRLTKYVDLWQSANAKLSTGSYHTDDLVDDWSRWLGMVSRDAVAAATLVFRGMAGAAGQGGGPDASEDDPGG